MGNPVALPRAITPGTTGPDVLAIKRALIRYLHGKPHGITLTQFMGAQAVEAVKYLQTHEQLQVDGAVGPATFARMAALNLFDAYGEQLLAQEQAALEPRARFLDVADATVLHVAIFDYTMALGDGPGQRGWFRSSPLDWKPRKSCDCSQHFIGCGHHAGLTHPIFSSDGATGEILELDEITLAEAQPGDVIVFVSHAEPAGEHVTILRRKLPNGDWETVNMGEEHQPANTTLSGEQVAHPGSWQEVRRLPV